MKTRKAIRKRFKFTKSGKLLRRAAGQNHGLAKKGSKKRRSLRRWIEVVPQDAKVIKKLLLY